MKAGRTLLLFLGTMTVAAPTMANQPPEPPMMLAEILILPAMMILTALGGGYAIRRAKGETSPRGIVLICILVVFFSGINEGLGILVAFFFGIYALMRAIRMFLWGYAATHRNPPEYLASAHPVRLLIAATLLTVITVFLMGLALAAFDSWRLHIPPAFYPFLEEVVTYELAYGELQKEQTGVRRFDPLVVARDDGIWDIVEITFSDKLDAFTLHVLHSDHMPFWPYNYLITQDAFRADETGKVRKIEVTNTKQRCPADAPVVWQVEPLKIREYLSDMRKGIFRPYYLFKRVKSLPPVGANTAGP